MPDRQLRLTQTAARRAILESEQTISDVGEQFRRAQSQFDGWQAAKNAATAAAEQAKAEAEQALADGVTAADASRFVLNADQSLIHARASSAALTSTPLLGEPKSEWEECRKTIDRFDKLLVDLRKTGLSIITVIIGGAGFLLAQPATGSGSGQTSTLANVPSVKLAIFIVIEILILSTYFIDRVHQIWLVAAVERAKSLETLLGYKITGNLNSKVAGLSAVSIGPALYGLLLFLAWVIFWVSFASASPTFYSLIDFPSWTSAQAVSAISGLLGLMFIAWIGWRGR
jgi:hypothetical protein